MGAAPAGRVGPRALRGVEGPFASALGIGLPIQLEPLREYTLGTPSLRLGDAASGAAAAAHYARFLAPWRDADPRLRPLADGARRRPAALGRRG